MTQTTRQCPEGRSRRRAGRRPHAPAVLQRQHLDRARGAVGQGHARDHRAAEVRQGEHGRLQRQMMFCGLQKHQPDITIDEAGEMLFEAATAMHKAIDWRTAAGRRPKRAGAMSRRRRRRGGRGGRADAGPIRRPRWSWDDKLEEWCSAGGDPDAFWDQSLRIIDIDGAPAGSAVARSFGHGAFDAARIRDDTRSGKAMSLRAYLDELMPALRAVRAKHGTNVRLAGRAAIALDASDRAARTAPAKAIEERRCC
jgi:hypothetical protein